MYKDILRLLALLTVIAALCYPLGCSDNPTSPRERLMALSETNLEFSSWAGENPYPAQRKVTVTIDKRTTIAWTATTESDWLRIGPPGTDTIYISVISTDLQSGIYTDSITVRVPDATNGPLYIKVELTVFNQVGLTPSTMTFASLAGGTAPASQDLVIANFGVGSASYTAETGSSWLNVSSLSGGMPDTIEVLVDITGLNAGIYMDSIVVSSPELPRSRAVVYCYLGLSSWDLVGLGRIDVVLEDVQFVNSECGWASGWLPGGYRQGYVFRSVDGGLTWPNVPSIYGSTILGGLAALDETRCFVVGDSADMFFTSNSGSSWTRVSTLPIPAGTALREIVFADYAHGWAVGNGGTIISTADSGATWTKRTTSTSLDLTGISFVDTLSGWVAGDHGTILRTINGGVSWTTQISGTSLDLRSVSFVDNLNGWAVGANGIVLHTTDGGDSWETQADVGDALLLDVVFVGTLQGWVVGIDGAIHRTDDGGLTWLEQTSGTTQILTEVFFLDDKVGWVVGAAGTVIRTFNGGF